MSEKVWREIDRFQSWDKASALRAATMDDNPRTDVRIRFWGQRTWIVEVSGPEKGKHR